MLHNRWYAATAVVLLAVALAVLATGCSNDNPAAPNSPNNNLITKTAAGGSASDPGPPAEGVVVEGVSVPGIALGSTRGQVVEAYGDDTLWCQSSGAPGNEGFCAWAVSGGGQVDVHFRGADGGVAGGTPDDVVSKVTWSEAVSGWTTTAGVNTTLAREDPQAVIDTYPNARVTYRTSGAISSVIDYPLGIAVVWMFIPYPLGTTSIRMEVFDPTEEPPLPELLTYVHDIELLAKKVKGKRQIRAWVRVRNQAHLAASGATVFARWTFPDGSTQAAESVTSGSGSAYLEINNVPRGTYTLTVEDVVLKDHRFDSENSVLSASVKAK